MPLAHPRRRAALGHGARPRAFDSGVGHLEGVVFDITARHDAEDAARLGEANLKQIMDLLPVAMFVADAAGNLVDINPAGRELWSGERRVGTESYDEYKAWWPATGKRLEAGEWALARTLRSGETVRGEEVDIETFDGKRKTILNYTMPLRDGNGRISGGISVNVDITDFRRTEAELRAAAHYDDTQRRALELFSSSFDREAIGRRLLALLAETQPLPVAALYLFDEWRGRHVRIAAHGAAAGVPAEFAPGEGLLGEAARRQQPVLLPVDNLGIATGIGDFLPAEVLLLPVIYQKRTLAVLVVGASRHLNGREREFLANLAGQTGVALNNLRQYDDLRALSDQLRARGEEIAAKNQQLEVASRMKSEFLANMSHELRTPLNAIIGFSEVLRDGLAGEISEKQREYVQDICDSGSHLLNLINDILDLSKVEAGRMTLELEEVTPKALLDACLTIQREKAAQHRLSLTADASAAPGTLWLDLRKAKQILYNLLANAVRFTPEGGRITLTASRLPAPTGDWLELAVRDTGIGISTADQARLFTPFTQIDSSLSRQHAGTGLGLAMVRRLAELHGGSAQVESVPGLGSTFSVRLPWRNAADAPPPATTGRAPSTAVDASSSTGAANGRRVLVIEDDDQAADLLRLQLEDAGFAVTRSNDGIAGLAAAEAAPPDLITLDVLLPDIDGWSLLDRLKQSPALAAVPVVIVSIVADRQRGLALGAAQVLQKPVERAQLLAALQAAGLHPAGPSRSAEGAHGATQEAARVLVVDDDPKAVDLIAMHLRSAGFAVEEAYSGREAIETMRRSPPDLLVLDLLMPEVSGFEVIEALQGDAALQTVPVLVLTCADIDSATRERLMRRVRGILEKAAFNGETFLGEVRRALHGGTA